MLVIKLSWFLPPHMTAVIRVKIAHMTLALTAHPSFIGGWPKPARKCRGMRFPWPPGTLTQPCSVSGAAFICSLMRPELIAGLPVVGRRGVPGVI